MADIMLISEVSFLIMDYDQTPLIDREIYLATS
jgi:hypothetical protein